MYDWRCIFHGRRWMSGFVRIHGVFGSFSFVDKMHSPYQHIVFVIMSELHSSLVELCFIHTYV